MLTNSHAKDYPNFDPNVTASVRNQDAVQDRRRRVDSASSDCRVKAWSPSTRTIKSYLGGVGAESIKGRTGAGPVADV